MQENAKLLFEIDDGKLVAKAADRTYIISNNNKRKKDAYPLQLEIFDNLNLQKPIQTQKDMSNESRFDMLNFLLAEAQTDANNRQRTIDDTAEAVKKDYERDDIPELLGHTLKAITPTDNRYLEFYRTDGKKVTMYHQQNCCEDVWLDDVAGDFDDLVGSPLTVAEFYTHWGSPGYGDLQYTFYRLGTINGFVTLRWIGESNGYYSTDVDIKLEDGQKE